MRKCVVKLVDGELKIEDNQENPEILCMKSSLFDILNKMKEMKRLAT
jgi:hypothetical protein